MLRILNYIFLQNHLQLRETEHLLALIALSGLNIPCWCSRMDRKLELQNIISLLLRNVLASKGKRENGSGYVCVCVCFGVFCGGLVFVCVVTLQ